MAYADLEEDRAAKRAHYYANREQYRARNIEQLRRHRAIVDDAKSHPCVDCGVQYNPWVMQFDHVTGDKVMEISRLIKSGNLSKILAEIEKCELVCANCHADRTYRRIKRVTV